MHMGVLCGRSFLTCSIQLLPRELMADGSIQGYCWPRRFTGKLLQCLFK
jgi:hypothetical protein